VEVLNLAMLAAAGWYGYLEVFVPTWNPYEPAFRAIGTAVLGRCTAELHAAPYRGEVWYQVRFEPVACWNDAKRAWLVVGGAERLQLSGSRNRFRASTLAADARGLSAGAIVLEIEYWDATRETAEFAALSNDRSASTAGSEDDLGAPNANVAADPASPASGRSDHTARQRRAGRTAWTRSSSCTCTS
jgi:hypothetical protein